MIKLLNDCKFEFENPHKDPFNLKKAMNLGQEEELSFSDNHKFAFSKRHNILFAGVESSLSFFNLNFIRDLTLTSQTEEITEEGSQGKNFTQISLSFAVSRIFLADPSLKDLIVVSLQKGEEGAWSQDIYKLDIESLINDKVDFNLAMSLKVSEKEEQVLKVEESSPEALLIGTNKFLYAYSQGVQKKKIDTDHFYFDRSKKTAFFVENKELRTYSPEKDLVQTLATLELEDSEVCGIYKLNEIVLVFLTNSEHNEFSLTTFNLESKETNNENEIFDIIGVYEIENVDEISLEPFFQLLEDSQTLLVSFNIFQGFQLVSLENQTVNVLKVSDEYLPQLNIYDKLTTFVKAMHVLNAKIQPTEAPTHVSKSLKDADGNPLRTNHKPWILFVDNHLQLQIRSLQDYRQHSFSSQFELNPQTNNFRKPVYDAKHQKKENQPKKVENEKEPKQEEKQREPKQEETDKDQNSGPSLFKNTNIFGKDVDLFKTPVSQGFDFLQSGNFFKKVEDKGESFLKAQVEPRKPVFTEMMKNTGFELSKFQQKKDPEVNFEDSKKPKEELGKEEKKEDAPFPKIAIDIPNKSGDSGPFNLNGQKIGNIFEISKGNQQGGIFNNTAPNKFSFNTQSKDKEQELPISQLFNTKGCDTLLEKTPQKLTEISSKQKTNPNLMEVVEELQIFDMKKPQVKDEPKKEVQTDKPTSKEELQKPSPQNPTLDQPLGSKSDSLQNSKSSQRLYGVDEVSQNEREIKSLSRQWKVQTQEQLQKSKDDNESLVKNFLQNFQENREKPKVPLEKKNPEDQKSDLFKAFETQINDFKTQQAQWEEMNSTLFELNKSLQLNLQGKKLNNDLGREARTLQVEIEKVKRVNDFQRLDLNKIQAEVNSTKVIKKPTNDFLEILDKKYQEFQKVQSRVQDQVSFSYRLISQIYGLLHDQNKQPLHAKTSKKRFKPVDLSFSFSLGEPTKKREIPNIGLRNKKRAPFNPDNFIVIQQKESTPLHNQMLQMLLESFVTKFKQELEAEKTKIEKFNLKCPENSSQDIILNLSLISKLNNTVDFNQIDQWILPEQSLLYKKYEQMEALERTFKANSEKNLSIIVKGLNLPFICFNLVNDQLPSKPKTKTTTKPLKLQNHMTFGTEETHEEDKGKNKGQAFNLNEMLEPKKAQYLQNINNKDILADSKKKKENQKQQEIAIGNFIEKEEPKPSLFGAPQKEGAIKFSLNGGNFFQLTNKEDGSTKKGVQAQENKEVSPLFKFDANEKKKEEDSKVDSPPKAPQGETTQKASSNLFGQKPELKSAEGEQKTTNNFFSQKQKPVKEEIQQTSTEAPQNLPLQSIAEMNAQKESEKPALPKAPFFQQQDTFGNDEKSPFSKLLDEKKEEIKDKVKKNSFFQMKTNEEKTAEEANQPPKNAQLEDQEFKNKEQSQKQEPQQQEKSSYSQIIGLNQGFPQSNTFDNDPKNLNSLLSIEKKETKFDSPKKNDEKSFIEPSSSFQPKLIQTEFTSKDQSDININKNISSPNSFHQNALKINPPSTWEVSKNVGQSHQTPQNQSQAQSFFQKITSQQTPMFMNQPQNQQQVSQLTNQFTISPSQQQNPSITQNQGTPFGQTQNTPSFGQPGFSAPNNQTQSVKNIQQFSFKGSGNQQSLFTQNSNNPGLFNSQQTTQNANNFQGFQEQAQKNNFFGQSIQTGNNPMFGGGQNQASQKFGLDPTQFMNKQTQQQNNSQQGNQFLLTGWSMGKQYIKDINFIVKEERVENIFK